MVISNAAYKQTTYPVSFNEKAQTTGHHWATDQGHRSTVELEEGIVNVGPWPIYGTRNPPNDGITSVVELRCIPNWRIFVVLRPLWEKESDYTEVEFPYLRLSLSRKLQSALLEAIWLLSGERVRALWSRQYGGLYLHSRRILVCRLLLRLLLERITASKIWPSVVIQPLGSPVLRSQTRIVLFKLPQTIKRPSVETDTQPATLVLPKRKTYCLSCLAIPHMNTLIQISRHKPSWIRRKRYTIKCPRSDSPIGSGYLHFRFVKQSFVHP